MTPISRFYARVLPAGWVYPAVTLTYLLGFLTLLLLARNPEEMIIYVDLR